MKLPIDRDRAIVAYVGGWIALGVSGLTCITSIIRSGPSHQDPIMRHWGLGVGCAIVIIILSLLWLNVPRKGALYYSLAISILCILAVRMFIEWRYVLSPWK